MNEKILIIDDEPDIRDLLTAILRGEGYEVVTAADGEEGIARFREEHPDLIISDVRMPKMNGMEVLQIVRGSGSDVEVIILTGHGDEATAISCLRMGACDYIKKPLDDIEALLISVRRALRKLQAGREKQALMGRLLEGGALGILVADLETRRFLLANSSICRMLGYSEAELLQLRVADIHPGESLDLVLTEFDRMARLEKEVAFSLPCLRKDGTIFHADIMASSSILEGRKCVVGFFADVTERKLMEMELAEQARNLARMNEEILEASAIVKQALDRAEQASRAKTEFLMNMSHEFRTPLNAIVGFAQILKDEYYGPLNDRQRGYVGILAGGADRLNKLTENILQFAQLDKNDEKTQTTIFPLQEFLSAAVGVWRDEAAKRRIQLDIGEFTIKGDVTAQTMINTDQDKLRAVMNHLLSNAVKFTPDGGAVRVSARRVLSAEFRVLSENGDSVLSPLSSPIPDFIEISVEDTGIGIRGEDMARLFQPFTQLEGPLNKAYAGVGLGLALTKRLVKSLGGRIMAESEYGKGSRFMFTIPIS
jgi:hypothetical protein